MKFHINVVRREDTLRRGDPPYEWHCTTLNELGEPVIDCKTGYGHDAKDARNRAMDWANNYATVQTHTGTFTYDTETREFTRNDS